MATRHEKFKGKKISWVLDCLKSILDSGRRSRVLHGRRVHSSTRLTVTPLEERLAPATSLHWIGSTAANGNMWSVAANWLENQVPTSGDRLVFDTTTAGFSATANGFGPTNNLTGLTNLTIGINDASAAGDFTLSGSAIGLSTAAGTAIDSTLSVGTAATINNNITLAANTTVAVGLGSLTLGGHLSRGGLFDLTAGAPLVHLDAQPWPSTPSPAAPL